MSRSVLALFAHPDDESFICGGTLAAAAMAGHRVTLVCATKGEMGRRLGVPPTATRESLPVLREQELRAACRALGIADLRFLGLRDKTLDYYDPTWLAGLIVPIMAELRPDVVLTFHEENGGHPDHCAIGRASRLAFESGAAGNGARLYYILSGETREQQLGKAGVTPERLTCVPVGPEAARAKVAAYRAHRTQSELMRWLWAHGDGPVRRLTRPEYFLQGSGPARPGESALIS